MPQEVVGYVLCDDSYVWTKRGILTVQELEKTDCVLGLDIEKREPTFHELTCQPQKLEGDHSIRIISDASETVVPEQTKLYMISGKTAASSVVKGDLLDVFYRPKTFKMLGGLYSAHEKQYLSIDSKKIDVTENFSYLLGTQAIVQKWVMQKIVMLLESDVNWRKICATLKEAFREIGLRYNYDYKIFYRADRKKIIVMDESSDGFIPRMICQIFEPVANDDLARTLPQRIPLGLRLSPISIHRQFLEGVLDSRAKVSKGRLLKFYTFARDDEIHRFILMVLALFNIQPVYSFFNEPDWGLSTINTYLALPKEHLFDLKSLALASQDLLRHRKEDEITLYSTVKNVARIRRSHYVVFSPKEHWDIITDLVPIHSQKVSLVSKGNKDTGKTPS
jgi:hypothetical protein